MFPAQSGQFFIIVCGNKFFVQGRVWYFNNLTERVGNHGTSPVSIRLTGTTFGGLFKPFLNKFLIATNRDGKKIGPRIAKQKRRSAVRLIEASPKRKLRPRKREIGAALADR
jgi:hypothetical protein